MHLALYQRESPAPLRCAETLNIYLVANATLFGYDFKYIGIVWRLIRSRFIHTTFRSGFACGFVRLDVGLQLGCIGAVVEAS